MNVVVRIRPSAQPRTPTAAMTRDLALFGLDAASAPLITDHGDGKTVSALKESHAAPTSALTFKFGQVYDPHCTTESVYAGTLRPIVSNVLKGVPGCIFAYGQTGSGKTHTITGVPGSPGLLPLAVDEILKRTAADTDVVSSCVYLTYLEVYNEIIHDLLAPAASSACAESLTIKEDAHGRPVVPNTTRIPVASLEDAQAVVARGEAMRSKGANSMHERASRSHAVFTITVETKRVDAPSAVRVGVLDVVDLAGSETAVQSALAYPADCDATEVVQRRKALGDMATAHILERENKQSTIRNREGSHIRKSLLALVRVVQKLADKGTFIPYRDSKLTRLLRQPLDGNANTAIICTINPAEGKESISTLRFAATAQRIHRTPAATAVAGGGAEGGTMLRAYERQMSMLRMELQRSVLDERRRSDELQVVSEHASTELGAANAERAALKAKIDELNRSLFTTARTRDAGPPTPRRMAKELRCLDDPTMHRRSGSAPNRRRGAIVDPVAVEDAAVAGPPQWFRDGENRALAARNAALEAQVAALTAARDEALVVADAERDEREAALRRAAAAEASCAEAHHCVADLAAALAAHKQAAQKMEVQRVTTVAFCQALLADHTAAAAKKRGGGGCGGSAAGATRASELELPRTDALAELLRIPTVVSFDAASPSILADARALLIAA